MRADLTHLIRILHAEEPPKQIWQEPFDYDPRHYKRLCYLNGADPSSIDLFDYAEDMHYAESLQPDLFRYLLPICLDVWRNDLITNGKSGYGNFVEHLWPALASPNVLPSLTADEYAAVSRFMADALLDRLELETGLSFSGSGAGPATWFYALGAFCVVFPELPALWNTWWEMATPGHAVAGLQYISCLLYEDDRNPIFSPWTPDGGGPPGLWETKGHIYDRGWLPENVNFLQSALTVAFVRDRLRLAAQRVEGIVESAVPQQMLDDFAAHQPRLEIRLTELSSLLLASPLEVGEWSV